MESSTNFECCQSFWWNIPNMWWNVPNILWWNNCFYCCYSCSVAPQGFCVGYNNYQAIGPVFWRCQSTNLRLTENLSSHLLSSSQPLVFFPTSCLLPNLLSSSQPLVFFPTSCLLPNLLSSSQPLVFFPTSCLLPNLLSSSQPLVFFPTSCLLPNLLSLLWRTLVGEIWYP